MPFHPPKDRRTLAPRKSPKPIVIKPIPQRTLDAIAARVSANAPRKEEAHVDAHANMLREINRRNKEYWNKR